MKNMIRSLLILLMVVIVCLVAGPVHAGPLKNLVNRLGSRSKVAATQKTVTVQKSVATSNVVSGGCRMINGRLVCPRK